MIAEEVATPGIRGKLREVQHVSEEGGDVVFRTILDVIDLARDGIEIDGKNATLSNRTTDMETKLVVRLTSGRTMPGQITDAEEYIKALET